MPFQESKWIWAAHPLDPVNEYAEFICRFTAKNERYVSVRICAKSDYVFFINGKLGGFHQFPDFPDRKIYDEYDVGALTQRGENILAVLVLGKNYDTCSHIADGKGIIFEIVENANPILSSDERVLSRISRTYRSGNLHDITKQLGKSFYYDFTAESDWINGNDKSGFSPSVPDKATSIFFPRPVARISADAFIPLTPIGDGLYDAGREYVGYLYFDIESESEQTLLVSYGEHIADGTVRRKIHDRDFSFEFYLKKGRNLFRDYFLRLGMRYLRLESGNIKIRAVGLYEAVYPHRRIAYEGKSVPKDIYDTATHTLECCMHDYYEDCPWREQGQYTMDSRTQMLCGYYAFGETALPASSLRTMAHRLTAQDVFPITSPSSSELSIPSFSLIYPLMLKEYYQFSKDKSVLEDVYKNTKRMLDHYVNNRIDGLIPTMSEWNFFEWEDGLHNENEIFRQEYVADKFSFPVNAFFAIALENFVFVSEIIGKDAGVYRELLQSTKKNVHDAFYCPDTNLFCTYKRRNEKSHYSEYCQVLALYAEIAENDEKRLLLKTITKKNSLVPLTLSNYIFKYEVLLREGGYEEYIKKDVSDIWGYMLKNGATAFWETIKGEADFGGAGSLCHGWSAIPVYLAWKMDGSDHKK